MGPLVERPASPPTIDAYTLVQMHALEAGCSCFAIRRTSRRITRFYDQHLAAAGLRTTQYSLLAHLRSGEGVSMRVLAEQLDMDRSTLNRNVRPLIQSGWVDQRAGADPRTAVLGLTGAGRRKLAEARVLWRQAQAAFESLMGARGLASLHAGLDAAQRSLPRAPRIIPASAR